jgi:hypothetical protein
VWDGQTISVNATKVSTGGQSELDKVEIQAVETNSSLTIQTKYTGSSVNPPSVDYQIQVPRNVTVVSVVTQNGAVDVRDVKGNISATSSNGRIYLANITGVVSASTSNGAIEVHSGLGVRTIETSNGGITVDVPQIVENASITTSNGAVILNINPAVNMTVDLSTSNARIMTNDVPLTLISQAENTFRGSLGSGKWRLVVSTSNGNIILNKLAVIT